MKMKLPEGAKMFTVEDVHYFPLNGVVDIPVEHEGHAKRHGLTEHVESDSDVEFKAAMDVAKRSRKGKD